MTDSGRALILIDGIKGCAISAPKKMELPTYSRKEWSTKDVIFFQVKKKGCAMRPMRRVTLTFLILAMIATIVGCSPKGDPKETLEKYYSRIINEEYNFAYAYLSEADKKVTKRDDFILFMELDADVTRLNKVEITQVEKKGDTIVFDVVENRHDYMDEKDKDTTVKRTVVAEDGEWRVKAEGDFATLIVDRQAKIGAMYLNGTAGKALDPAKAATRFEDVLKRDPSFYPANYGLAASYVKLKKYEDAIPLATKYVESAAGNNEKSNGMNLIGICYDATGNKEKAKEAFQKAVELNPENQLAQKNLSRFK
ncbi:tetratricopeptide repeat protein [Brevibacillus panacihumi]|uniref:tetratricopeptide repeat protein n=1 Tax=Brevibacillus panacihumi TaxID=497735 RepID=UPI003D01008F